jgi:glycerol-3-phosphate acyltransferase PlsY
MAGRLTMLELGTKILIAYLIGSLNGSLVIGRLYGIDIRREGSGNAGGTNALRTQGRIFALLVMSIDVGKGYLVAHFLPGLALPGIPLDPEVSRIWLMLACAGATIVGHCYPVWFGFVGGKGAATAVGVLIAIAPGLLLTGAAVFAGVLVLSGYVGLATITSAVALPVYVAVTRFEGNQPLCLFLVLMAAFIVFTHRANIQRMREGRENRLESAMLLRR